MNHIIPAERILETASLVVFFHPKPVYHFHVVIIPKKPTGSLMSLDSGDALFLGELFQAVKTLINQFELEKIGYRLIVNGGANQVTPYLHFHLVSGEELTDVALSTKDSFVQSL
jgi:diadenosine tetraphosphate (Ap4A) HIT family hydrolase